MVFAEINVNRSINQTKPWISQLKHAVGSFYIKHPVERAGHQW